LPRVLAPGTPERHKVAGAEEVAGDLRAPVAGAREKEKENEKEEKVTGVGGDRTSSSR
jgi:hypothetical protein